MRKTSSRKPATQRSKAATNPTASKPITQLECIADLLILAAEATGQKPAALGRAFRKAIRSRHHEATVVDHPSRNQPDVFTLLIGGATVYYTIEAEEIVIRGYGWDVIGEPLDDFDGGGFVTEYHWR